MAQNKDVVEAMKVFSLICLLMSAVRSISAAKFTVGEAKGWIIGYNYTAWAASKTIHVGDTLLFRYNKDYHNVIEVTKLNYDSCNSSAPVATYEDGKTIISLAKPGPHYYLCGFTGHCGAGQKLDITVLATAPSPSPASKQPPSSNITAPALSPAPKSFPHNKTAPSFSPSLSPTPSPTEETPQSPASQTASSHSPAFSPSRNTAPSPSQTPSPSPNSAMPPPVPAQSPQGSEAHTQSAGLVSLGMVWVFYTMVYCL